MKKIVLWCMCLLLIIALLPLASGIKGIELSDLSATTNTEATDAPESEPTTNETDTEDTLTDEEIEIIVCKVMEHITQEAATETKKAMLAICKNNYLYLKESGETDFETEISKYSDDFFGELLKFYEENQYIILLERKRVAIPLVPQNGGFTATSDEYPYIEPVASPWDTFSKSYIRGGIYPCGVSIYGVGYLCDNGMDWNEALRYYLPDFEIT